MERSIFESPKPKRWPLRPFIPQLPIAFAPTRLGTPSKAGTSVVGGKHRNDSFDPTNHFTVVDACAFASSKTIQNYRCLGSHFAEKYLNDCSSSRNTFFHSPAAASTIAIVPMYLDPSLSLPMLSSFVISLTSESRDQLHTRGPFYASLHSKDKWSISRDEWIMVSHDNQSDSDRACRL